MSACRPSTPSPPLRPSPPPRVRLPSSSTAILRDQCCVPDLNRDPVRSVLRAGPQPRSCEISVACRTSTAILRDQCCMPDLNRDPVRSVLRAGPQPLKVYHPLTASQRLQAMIFHRQKHTKFGARHDLCGSVPFDSRRGDFA